MSRHQLLDRLAKQLPGQFELIRFKLDVPREFLHGSQAEKAVQVIEYLENRDGGLTRLAELLGVQYEQQASRQNPSRQGTANASGDLLASPRPPPSARHDAPGRPRPMTSNGDLTILHISDLHISKKWLPDTKIVLEAFWRDLETCRDKHGLVPDLICFTGDIAQAGKKEEFELAAELFFDPMLEKLRVSKERLFWVPGNHDVDRRQINRYLERGLLGDLKDRASVNELLDDETHRADAFARLNAYAEFTREYFGDLLPDGQDPLYFTTHTLTIGSRSVGIACLNSGWRCGGDEDRGRLWIGDRQLHDARQAVADADLKIALVHHPFDWLHDHEQSEARRLCIREFDLVLRGHMHAAEVSHHSDPDGHCIMAPTGAMYQGRKEGRDWWEGYSWVRLGADRAQIFLRRYVDRRHKFVTDTQTADRGVFTVNFPGARN